jgi:hypothetical protein
MLTTLGRGRERRAANGEGGSLRAWTAIDLASSKRFGGGPGPPPNHKVELAYEPLAASTSSAFGEMVVCVDNLLVAL